MLMHPSLFATVLAVFAGYQQALAFPHYAQKIPNGYSVPNPGPQGGVWAGVGHEQAAGGGERNPFGNDFAASDHEWTVQLCQADSDGDGRPNGVELGDPDCVWMEGDDPAGPALSHPGIMDEAQVIPSVSSCEDYVAPDDELTLDIAFSAPTQMDETQTHYICEQRVLDVPAQTTLHMIKTGILLDNTDVLHHMFVYICPANATSTDGERIGQGAYECNGNESGCRRIGGWAIGPHEKCQPPSVGIDLDFSSDTKVVVKIEAHYDNTSGQPQNDQSGIRLYMTPTLRPLTGTQLITGMATANIDFVIPAQQSRFPLLGICPTELTERLAHPVYAYAFTPHMHYYGKSMVTEHYRCGQKIGEIGRISNYEFDNQQTYSLDPPVKILPGDAFVTTCNFDTTSADLDIRGGEETTDEMCLNFLSVYPNPATESHPSLMNACFSFEHGLEAKNGRTIDVPIAVGDRDGQTVTMDFETDPLLSIGSCCAAQNCEELYLAGVGVACGVDADCIGSLMCQGGLCASGNEEMNGTTASTGEDTDAASEVLDTYASGGTATLTTWSLVSFSSIVWWLVSI